MRRITTSSGFESLQSSVAMKQGRASVWSLAYVTRSPEDAGAKHERKRKLVTLEQSS